ncbi:hypothetical protein C0991_002357 [Blastosporella zonata]|nr:hypothetical protein C0991_002357 [Blastosporella zonata]
MPKSPKPTSITLALYPLSKDPDSQLTHPLLWSDLPEDLPELSEEEVLTWDQIATPTGPEFSIDKLMAILALKNNPPPTPYRANALEDCVSSAVSASENDASDLDDRSTSDSSDTFSDLELSSDEDTAEPCVDENSEDDGPVPELVLQAPDHSSTKNSQSSGNSGAPSEGTIIQT